MKITDINHPAFTEEQEDWCKYRLTYEGGRCFVDRYLERMSTRENENDFLRRKRLTYCPAFAKAAINEIKNVIFNRLRDVTRLTESNTYNECVLGNLRGVDNGGATMDYFIGQYVIPELLTMRKVGVYVDMPANVPQTLIGSQNKHPYLYLYKAESIRSWKYADPADPREFKSVLLYEDQLEYDAEYDLPKGNLERMRYAYIDERGRVTVEFFNMEGESIDIDGNKAEVEYKLNIKEIPFVIFEISDSLLKDVADYQIALLNMESADISYAISSNFPLYVEQTNDNINNADDIPIFNQEDTEVTETAVTEAKDKEVKVGPTYGRQYPKDSAQPAFIHPSSEPLKAAMDKEKQIKKDIKLLINLAVNDLSDKMVSAESKQQDESGKQTGLACVAYVLENGEQKLARYWGNYESIKEDSIVITYPKDYDLKSDEERQKDCEQLWELLEKVPSKQFKKEILKKIIRTLFSNKVSRKVIEQMESEIDKAKGLISTVEHILSCQEKGLVDDKSASELLGFVDGLVEKAKKDHAEKLALIQASQGGEGGSARGVPQTQMGQRTSSSEKEGKQKRGAAK